MMLLKETMLINSRAVLNLTTCGLEKSSKAKRKHVTWITDDNPKNVTLLVEWVLKCLHHYQKAFMMISDPRCARAAHHDVELLIMVFGCSKPISLSKVTFLYYHVDTQPKFFPDASFTTKIVDTVDYFWPRNLTESFINVQLKNI